VLLCRFAARARPCFFTESSWTDDAPVRIPRARLQPKPGRRRWYAKQGTYARSSSRSVRLRKALKGKAQERGNQLDRHQRAAKQDWCAIYTARRASSRAQGAEIAKLTQKCRSAPRRSCTSIFRKCTRPGGCAAGGGVDRRCHVANRPRACTAARCARRGSALRSVPKAQVRVEADLKRARKRAQGMVLQGRCR